MQILWFIIELYIRDSDKLNLILGLNQYPLFSQLPQKMMLALKVLKRNRNFNQGPV